MFSKLGIALLGFLLLQAQSCGSGGGGSSSQANAPVASAPVASATAPVAAGGANTATPPGDRTGTCALIEPSEIEAVQGAKVQNATPSEQASGQLAISQCYYTVISADGTKNLSVHLEVMRGDPKGGDRDAVKEFWGGRFRREAGGEESERERERERGEEGEEKESAPPLAVRGVGEEAFWVGNNKMGALHVLEKDKVLRVSVGGPGDAKGKIEKSKALAQKALARLK